MQHRRFLIVVIVLLVLLNLGTLSFLWINRPGERENRRPHRTEAPGFLIRELNLTGNQRKEFIFLRNRHWQTMEVLQQHDQDLHSRFFDLLLSNPVDSKAVENMADSMSQTRRTMEILTFEHFSRMRQILNPEQQKKFDSIFHKTIRMILPVPPPPPLSPRK
jgi:periplasmic protein CpxP/Spy